MKIRNLMVAACLGLLLTGCSNNEVKYETENSIDSENLDDGASSYEPDSIKQFSQE